MRRPLPRPLALVADRPALAVGLGLVGLVVVAALLSNVWTPEVPTRIRIAAKLRAPLVEGLLGTDQLGRDVASMLMVGAWNSLTTAVLAVGIGGAIGTFLGVVAAARRGIVETATMRAVDVIFAFPPILSAMMLGALLGSGRGTAIVAIAVFMVPVFARVAFGAALRVWARDYALAARAAGKGAFLITVEHVLPNVSDQIIVQAAVQLGLAMLTEAGLGFLGLGLPPPSPTWGRMLAESQTYLGTAPWLAIAPGAAIALAVFGFNMLGDGLRDLFDPRGAGR